MNLESEIKNIGDKIKEEKNLKKISELLSEVKEKCESAKREEFDEIEVLVFGNFSFVIGKCENFAKKWGNSEINPTDEELDNVEELVKVIINDIKRLSEEDFPAQIFGDNYLSNSRKNLEDLEMKIFLKF